MKKFFVFIFIFIVAAHISAQNKVWSVDKANAWSKKRPWLRGANFQPSTAINQLEMFQAETFDTITIDKELALAEDLGMNCMRVFMHHVAWETDKEGFKKRLNKYLEISSKHKIGTMLVFFDDCWNQTYKVGKQPEPKLGIHNSGWLRDPGDLIFTDPTLIVTLEEYVKDILTTFANDKRIIIWDLYNEPGNNGLNNKSLPLVEKVFEWARAVNPSQPLTSGIWLGSLKELNKFQLENSDVISYHNYEYVDEHHKQIDSLKSQFGRPMICSEYMARSKGSLFQTIMPLLKNENVGAINWGFVAGKTNTIFAWDTPIKTGEEPVLWFHDILRKDGTPFSEDEVKTIKRLTGKIK